MGIIITGLKILAWGYYLSPNYLKKFFGNSLGFILYFIRFRSPIIEQNLIFAFPIKEPSQEKDILKIRKQLFRSAYLHLGNLFFDVLMLFGPLKNYALRAGEITGLEHWKKAKQLGKGVIFLASHVGNWEIMAATGALHGQIDILLVTKHLKPKWLHHAIEKARLKYGVRAVYEPHTLYPVLTHLRQNRTVGFILDQYAGPPISVRVPVFGIPVGTTTVVAVLAKRTGAMVLPVVNYRLPTGGWRVEFRPALNWETHPDAVYEIALNTARYVAELEQDIFRFPEQWLWTHRRFKGDLSPLREREWSEQRLRQ